MNDEGRHVVHDGERELQFTGRLLGESSSWCEGKERWAEIKIFRTRAGAYIVSGVGRSVINGEVQKRWAQVCDRPEAVVERLHMLDGKEARYLPYVNRVALQKARMADAGIANAFLRETVD